MASEVTEKTKNLIEQGDFLFTQRNSSMLLSLWQESAEQFYPERAQFTTNFTIGRNLADNLTTSYPILCRRDLGNIISAMLRPSSEDWMEVGTRRPDKEDQQGKKWLEWASETQRRAMYDHVSGFMRATKEADHDFVTFGQAAISCVLGRGGDTLSLRSWHLRDMAWAEDETGQIDTIFRKWRPTARNLVRMFKDKVAKEVADALEKTPYREFNCQHMVVPSDYDGNKGAKRLGTQFASIFVDSDNRVTMEERGVHNIIYVIPRWQTVSGSQYSYSPAAIAALPDARLIQDITLVLLDAGEKAVDPPRVMAADSLRSDIQLFAGGITVYDKEYDEGRGGEFLRPVGADEQNLNYGVALRENIKQMIMEAFYLNKIGLPPIGRDMTAFEVGQRVSEYVRNALPLFEPIENEYNAKLCELIFDVMMRAGAFGSPLDIPQSIRGADIQFKFQSPLAAALETKKGQKYQQMKAMLAEGMAIDQGVLGMVDNEVALRDALEGVGTPASWMRSEDEAAKFMASIRQKADAQQQIAQIGAGADAANSLGQAAQNLGMLPPPGQARRPGSAAPAGALV